MKTTLITIMVGLILNIVSAQPTEQDYTYQSIELFGQTIKYIEQGTGETVLLLHGLGSNSDRWTKNIEVLSQSYNVIAIDQIGFGYSDKPQMPYRGATLVEFLNEFLVEKGIDKASIIGNSMGG